MTETNEKIRSLFLTALMVFSVFAMSTAFAGSAAAAEPSVDQAVHYTAGNAAAGQVSGVSEGDPVLEVQFENSINDPSGETITLGLTNGNTQTLSLSGNYYHSGSQLVIDTGGTTYNRIQNVSFSSGVTDASSSDTIDAEEDFDAVYAPTTIDVTDTERGTSPDGDDEEAFRGAPVVVQADAGQTFDVVSEPSEDHSVSRQRGTGSESFIYVLNTENLEIGDYNVKTDSAPAGNTNSSLTIEDLGFTATADQNSFGEDEDIEVTVESSAINRPVDAELIDSNGNVDADTYSQNLQIDSDGEITITFNTNDDVDAGNYTVNVTDVETGITASTDQFTVAQTGDAQASFGSSVVTEDKGDIARIPIQLQNTDDGTLTIGDRSNDGYQTTVEVEDGNGDGEVTVLFNTFTAASGQSYIDVADDDDDVEIVSSPAEINRDGNAATFNTPAGNNLLDAASYDMNVTAETGASALKSTDVVDDSDDVASLSLQERSTDNVQVWTAPDSEFSDISDAADDDNASAIYNLAGNNNLTQTDTVAFDDTLVVQVEASGLEGAYEAAGDDAAGYQAVSNDFNNNTSSRNQVSDALFQLSLNETNPGANSDGVNFNVADFNTNEIAVLYDEANDTHFVAIDTDSVNAGTGTLSAVEDNDEYVANFTVRDTTELSEDTVEVNDSFTFEEPDSTLNGDEDITVQAASGQEIDGTTNIAPGSEVTVQIRSTTENSPFLKQPTAIVQSDGSFTAVADFSDNSPDTNFTAETSISDDEIDGTIGAAPSSSVSISDQESNGETVVVDSATLSEGGFIAIHNGTASGDVIGASSYLEAGSHEDVEVTLNTTQSEDFTAVAMPHLDDDGDQTYDFPENDDPYTSNGSAVTDSAAVTIVTGEQTTTEEPTTESTTEEPTTESTTEEATTMATTTEGTTTGDSGPGFTAVIALVALVAAALLAVRRDN
ncbi:DUF7282 domain-containing protein [Haloarcula pellucida]|uniref:Cadherin domain-containing protein n=1 Tax=Haloarcula pellucida TaxID=1427151 RepID=A0A830GP06_9EURY|nr:BGTF surface domain-containing protein [Halomicroarcula pellucida]MBX0348001.1 surface glycoprotein [Halomicroarcula pellucida]GGN96452.1 hypothetical protein GCM10009030_24730 [Halomicroarcula pellucida]